MLAAIESRLEELFETIESLPPEKVEAAEKVLYQSKSRINSLIPPQNALLQAKEKERRMRLREEKMEEQRLAQEERLKRALERAQADPKKRVTINMHYTKPLQSDLEGYYDTDPLISHFLIYSLRVTMF